MMDILIGFFLGVSFTCFVVAYISILMDEIESDDEQDGGVE